jgi:hypothetical protein
MTESDYVVVASYNFRYEAALPDSAFCEVRI